MIGRLCIRLVIVLLVVPGILFAASDAIYHGGYIELIDVNNFSLANGAADTTVTTTTTNYDDNIGGVFDQYTIFLKADAKSKVGNCLAGDTVGGNNLDWVWVIIRNRLSEDDSWVNVCSTAFHDTGTVVYSFGFIDADPDTTYDNATFWLGHYWRTTLTAYDSTALEHEDTDSTSTTTWQLRTAIMGRKR